MGEQQVSRGCGCPLDKRPGGRRATPARGRACVRACVKLYRVEVAQREPRLLPRRRGLRDAKPLHAKQVAQPLARELVGRVRLRRYLHRPCLLAALCLALGQRVDLLLGLVLRAHPTFGVPLGPGRHGVLLVELHVSHGRCCAAERGATRAPLSLTRQCGLSVDSRLLRQLRVRPRRAMGNGAPPCLLA